MNDVPYRGDNEGELRSELVDLAGLDWDRLSAMPDSVLAESLRRILRENSASVDEYASFQNRI